MKYADLKEAINSGHKASSILYDVLEELAQHHNCPKGYGLEGGDVLVECGVCVRCLAKQIMEEEDETKL